MDWNQANKWCDPYVEINYLKNSYKSKPAKYIVDRKSPKHHSADIDHTFMLPVQWPSSVDRLVIEIKDSDDDVLINTGDDTLGSLVVSIKDLVKKYSRKKG